jgi:hypothetical protein
MDVIRDPALDQIAAHFQGQLTRILHAEPQPGRRALAARAIGDGLLAGAANGLQPRADGPSAFAGKWQELGDAGTLITLSQFECEAHLLNVFSALIAPSLAFDEVNGDAVEAVMVAALRADPLRRATLKLPVPAVANRRIAQYLDQVVDEPPSAEFFISVASTFADVCVKESRDRGAAEAYRALVAGKGLELFGISLESILTSLATLEVAAYADV